MYIKNNDETLINDITNDEFCVCEDYSIPEHERAAIDKVIEIYEPLINSPEHWVTLDEFERRMRRAVN